MFKLQAHLTHFRFHPDKHVNGPFLIEWYKLFENEDNSESYGVCLSENEYQELTDYIIKHPENFHHLQQKKCDNETTARCGNNDLKAIQSTKPRNIILRRKPLLTSKENEIFPCMDIELLNSLGALKPNITISFDLIGKVLEI
jgi:hypothetical protein